MTDAEIKAEYNKIKERRKQLEKTSWNNRRKFLKQVIKQYNDSNDVKSAQIV